MKKIILLTVIILMGCSEGTVTVTFSDKFFEKRLIGELDSSHFPYKINAQGGIEFSEKNFKKFKNIRKNLNHMMLEEDIFSYRNKKFETEFLKLLDSENLKYYVEVRGEERWIRLPPESKVHKARLETETARNLYVTYNSDYSIEDTE